MKKIFIILMLLFISVYLVGCDYPEKSFQVLRDEDVPFEVTRSFTLPKGHYGKFIWTSNNNALVIIEDNIVTVNQGEEDINVTLTAQIKNTKKTFNILVYKLGSKLTWKEQAEDAYDEIKELYHTIDDSILVFPKVYKGLYLKYDLDNSYTNYGFYEDEDNIYISNSFHTRDIENITIWFYKSSDTADYNNFILGRYIALKGLILNRLTSTYYQVFNEININNYDTTLRINLILEVEDYIEFSNHDLYDIKLEITHDSIKKINDTKYQIISNINSNNPIRGYLIITIDNMPKSFQVHIYERQNHHQ